MGEQLYFGIDVGTGSARAALFDRQGKRAGMGVQSIESWRPEEDFVEQSSDDIWDACGRAVRQALNEAGGRPEHVGGIGFDATCSLVALGSDDRPVTVSPTGHAAQNIVVWMDHRAVAQAERINATKHPVLRYVGGVMSPEMQPPKLLWLKEHLPRSWAQAAKLLDLPDFLTYRATGIDVRSLCTTVCKWTYQGHGQGWDKSFFEQARLGDLATEEFRRIGTIVCPMGERIGGLQAQAAKELGLVGGIPVGVSIIDAHAGGLGLLGASIDGVGATSETLDQRLALIGGTSSCHMAVSKEPRFIDGIWGPYFSAMVPGMWLTEGGQSATGALIDHVIASHIRGPELVSDAKRNDTTPQALLNDRIAELGKRARFPAELTAEFHVMPDFHGNRSPRANPSLRGMVSGLKLSDSIDALALLYLATVQAIAHGNRHIIETMNAKGYHIDTIIACGGDTKNPLFVREHADVSGCRVVLAAEPEAVLLGAAMLGAVAAGAYPDLVTAMGSMSTAGNIITPQSGPVAEYHGRKHEVFHRMHADQMAYRQLMR